MDFEQTLDYLYQKLPMFSRQGSSAYKKDLTNTKVLCSALNNPERQFKSIHVAGTNGKGSVSHMLASVLQEAGYKVGLYTSPHLKCFTERIRVNGREVPQDWVVHFVRQNTTIIEEVMPSFFEITVAMAFKYFAEEKVDIAIIETGLGGRLDSTNVIEPELSVITNIGLDHTDMLGDTLELIAAEKAGIIKDRTPVVISETQPETESIFFQKAHSVSAPIVFADRIFSVVVKNGQQVLVNQSNMEMIPLNMDLHGAYQVNNARAVLMATDLLKQLNYAISTEHIKKGLAAVKKNTGLRGRFEIVQQNPLVIFDVAHNKEGILQSLNELSKRTYNELHIIYGCVNDKDVSSVLPLFPQEAFFYFTQANVPRALSVLDLQLEAQKQGVVGDAYQSPEEALTAAIKRASRSDCILVIGSFFILETLI